MPSKPAIYRFIFLFSTWINFMILLFAAEEGWFISGIVACAGLASASYYIIIYGIKKGGMLNE